jgi:hypothetical protein
VATKQNENIPLAPRHGGVFTAAQAFKGGSLVFAVLTSLLVFLVYLKTLAPTVMFIDAGELSAVASTLGIAHPTGYPLFTIVGHLFTKLPISSSEVYNLNFMSGITVALGVFVFYFLMTFMLSSPSALSKGESQLIVIAVSVFSSLVLAFSNTVWAQANSVEVYSVHVFFLTTLCLVFLKAITTRSGSYFLLFGFLLGLSFSNHLTTILLAPGCLTIFFAEMRNSGKNLVKLLGWMAIFFILGFSVYLYLPIRASSEPLFLWGNPYNLERFKWHITGKQFSVWIFSAKGSVPIFLTLIITAIIFSVIGLTRHAKLNKNYPLIVFVILSAITFLALKNSNEIVVKQFDFFTESLWKEYGTGMIILGLLGIYRMSMFNLNYYYFTLLAFFGCVFYSVNYDIHDIASYFLLAYIMAATWIGFGAVLIYEKMKAAFLQPSSKGERKPVSQIAFSVAAVLLAGLTLGTNFSRNDESEEYAVEQYTMNVFRNIEPGGIIISSQWDFWLSASWYFQAVKKIRPDIVVIDKELLRRSWYFTYLQRHYPEIFENSKHEIERFMAELYKFEHGIPYDTKIIMKAFTDVLTSFVERNPGRIIYTTWEIEQNKEEAFAPNYQRIPDGLLNRLVKNDDFERMKGNIKTYDFVFTPNQEKDYYHETIMNTYAMTLSNSANYLWQLGQTADARKYAELALTAKPGTPQILDLLNRMR